MVRASQGKTSFYPDTTRKYSPHVPQPLAAEGKLLATSYAWHVTWQCGRQVQGPGGPNWQPPERHAPGPLRRSEAEALDFASTWVNAVEAVARQRVLVEMGR